jgi:hypothetical protein
VTPLATPFSRLSSQRQKYADFALFLMFVILGRAEDAA